MALSQNRKVRELYEAGEYTHVDGVVWKRGMDGWFDRSNEGYFIVWRHHDFVKYIEEKFPGDAEIKDISVWAEGYVATGERSDANYLGTFEAEDFDDAVRQYIKLNPEDEHLFRQHEDGHWTFWACRLFDNEADARRNFG